MTQGDKTTPLDLAEIIQERLSTDAAQIIQLIMSSLKSDEIKISIDNLNKCRSADSFGISLLVYAGGVIIKGETIKKHNRGTIDDYPMESESKH